MAKAAKLAPVTVMTMAEITKLEQKEAVSLFASKTTERSRLFVECAKLMLHIRTTLKPNETVYGLLKKAGVREATINNGAQAERVFTQFVTNGTMTEAQFDKLTYPDCVAFNAAVKKRGFGYVSSIQTKMDDVHSVSDSGMTVAEVKSEQAAADKRKADAAVAEALAAKEAEDAKPKPAATPEPAKPGKSEPAKKAPETQPAVEEKAPEPVIEEKTPPNLIELKKPVVTAETGRALLGSLESALAEMSEVDYLAVSEEIMALAERVIDGASAIRGKQQKAA